MRREVKAVEYVERATGQRVTEAVMGDGALRFAYETMLGRTLWPILFGSRVPSALLGWYYDSPRSRRAISQLASLPGCRVEEAEKPLADYPSFNAFFTRHLKPGARPMGEGVVSPADGRVRLFLDVSLDAPFPLKGAQRTLRTILGPLGKALSGALDVVVVRLAPVDYHRFHFPYACTTPESVRVLPGRYHSVNPVALMRHPDLYAENERQVVMCEAAFGRFWLIEVGAFGVGTIRQTNTSRVHQKGEEKGYFKFGGSTVIAVFQAGDLRFDEDLVRYSQAGLETRVLCGERLAVPSRASSTN